MEQKTSIVLALLISFIFLGCVQTQEPTQLTPTPQIVYVTVTPAPTPTSSPAPTAPAISAEETVRLFVIAHSASNLDENIAGLEKSKDYVTDEQSKNVDELLSAIKRIKKLYQNFITNYISDCQALLKQKDCDDAKTSFEKEVAFAASSKTIQIVNIGKLGPTLEHATIFVESEEKDPYARISYLNTTYAIVRVENEWKVAGTINETAPSLTTEQLRKIYDDFIDLLNKTYTARLAALNKLKNDQCNFVYRLDLTQTELKSQLDTCYRGRYISYVQTQNNAAVCEEIYDEYYRGLCYGVVALKNLNENECNKMTNVQYNATGFRDPLSTRDICIGTYASGQQRETRQPTCNLIENQQLKANCENDLYFTV